MLLLVLIIPPTFPFFKTEASRSEIDDIDENYFSSFETR